MMLRAKQNTWWGIGLSLALHGLAAVVLLSGLAGNMVTRRDLGRLDLMWISIAGGDKTKALPRPRLQAGRPKAPRAENQTVAPPSRTDAQAVRAGSEKSLEGAAAGPVDKTMISSGMKTVADDPRGGDSPGVDARRITAAPVGSPASSLALPLYRENPSPGYPAMAREQGYEGVVLVKAEVLTNGRVGQTVVRKSSGYAILDQAAVSAVKTWKFEPAKKSGIPYKTWAELPIKFVISDRNSRS